MPSLSVCLLPFQSSAWKAFLKGGAGRGTWSTPCKARRRLIGQLFQISVTSVHRAPPLFRMATSEAPPRLSRARLRSGLLPPLGTLPARISPAACARVALSGPPPALSCLLDLPRAPAARAAAVGAPRVRGACGVLSPLIGAPRGAFIRPSLVFADQDGFSWSSRPRPPSRTRWSREERTDPEARGTISRPQ